jgi:hypothetical protein
MGGVAERIGSHPSECRRSGKAGGKAEEKPGQYTQLKFLFARAADWVWREQPAQYRFQMRREYIVPERAAARAVACRMHSLSASASTVFRSTSFHRSGVYFRRDSLHLK